MPLSAANSSSKYPQKIDFKKVLSPIVGDAFSKLELLQLYLKEHEARVKAERLSEVDDITELLLNKRGWRQAIKEEGFHAVRHKEQFAVLFIDLDNLKLVDDTFGHEKGTVYIKLFAKVLDETLRPEDIKAHPQGDEFFAFLPKVTNSEVEEIRDQLVWNFDEAVKKLKPHDELYEASRSIAIGPSVGIAHKTWAEEERRSILKSARKKAVQEVSEIIREVLKKADKDSYKMKEIRKGGARHTGVFVKTKTLVKAKTSKLLYYSAHPLTGWSYQTVKASVGGTVSSYLHKSNY